MSQRNQIVLTLVLFCNTLGLLQCGQIKTAIELVEANKQLLLDEHNRLRRVTSPTASNMQEMIWDLELATHARNQSRTCEFVYSPQATRKTDKFSQVGENIYYTQYYDGLPNRLLADGVQKWYDEMSDYNYTQNSCAQGEDCGHYKQVV